MKKQFIMLLMAVSTFFVGCQYDDDFTPPNYVTFEDDEMDISVLDTGTESLEVTVYTANTTGSDRTYTINVNGEASTLDASTYTLPATVTVPANSNEATFNVEIVGAGIDDYGDELVLELQEEAGLSAGDSLTIDVLKVCPFDINSFVGTYAATEVFTAGRNRGYSFLGGASQEVILVPNDADASGNSLVLTTKDGFTKLVADGTVITFDPATGEPSFPEGQKVLGFNFVQTSASVNTCAQVMDLVGNLHTYGEYTVTLSKISNDTDGGDTDGGDA